MAKNEPIEKVHALLIILFLILFLFSAYQPVDRLAWLGQVIAAVILVLVLVLTYRTFRFSTFVYLLVFFHLLFLLYGAHYTYSENPLFHFLKEQFGWQRNYFDRVGHFAQGFVPAFLVKEFLVRGGHIKKGPVMRIIVIMVCLGFSALYELSEFALTIIFNVPVDDVMGTQGDVFDSYWDMFWALIGANLSVFIFGNFHDRQMEKN